jgi:hypothetical protein
MSLVFVFELPMCSYFAIAFYITVQICYLLSLVAIILTNIGNNV